MGAKVELMEFSPAIGGPYGFEVGMLETFQPGSIRYFGIEASAAELPVSPFDGAVVDDVVARRALATTVTTDLVAHDGFECVHVV
jgi:hypothetical protein